VNLEEVDWRQLRGLPHDEMRGTLFGIIREASLQINTRAVDDPVLLNLVPRLADLIPNNPELSDLAELYSALARATGLWNYIDKENSDFSDEFVAEAVTSPELGGVTFHKEQIEALNVLLAGRNLILSAPTSFGKSLLIDALIASGRYSRIAIVLPTIALLDEFRRRLTRRFQERFSIVMHHTDMPDRDDVIFLGTQERLISRADLTNLDLTVVDEFYKLDPSRRDDRSSTLNAAVYKLLNRSKQFFFLGPNIDQVTVPKDERWSFQFLRTRFSTVAVETFDLTSVVDKEERLLTEIGEEDHWPALVFVSSPDRANAISLKAASAMAVSDTSDKFADWLRVNVGPKFPLAKSVEFGFGVHHGRLPRSIAAHMVRLFNTNDIPVLFCTSTLIEGVNTAAKTVLIFDKKINRRNYDFFTFANIRGRAGRLGQHHVGQVFLFNSPPDVETTEVAPTLFDDEEDAPDDFVVHLEEGDASEAVDDRLQLLMNSLGLDHGELRIASAVGLETALELKGETDRALRTSRALLWSGRGTYDELRPVISVICAVKSSREFGAYSADQLLFFVNRLRSSSSMKVFLNAYDESYKGDEIHYDSIFKFLRACEYGLPQLFALVETFVNKRVPGGANYSLFLAELPRWFGPEVLKNLDEEGIPIQISERFYRRDDTRADLLSRMAEAARSNVGQLSAFERDWIVDALDLEDVGNSVQ
jgi:hypothetical protein